MILLAALLLTAPAWGATIPASALGVELDAPLSVQYLTGEALPLKGTIRDRDKADGQILFNFVPRTGEEPFQLFLNLDGPRFAGYQIFGHDQSGTYDLEVYLGGPGETQMGFIGVYEGMEIGLGSGAVRLPEDFFPKVVLDTPFAIQFSSGEALLLAGRISDPLLEDGQLLWVLAPLDGGEEKRFYLPLRGDRFIGEQVFRHEEIGRYRLALYLGGAGQTSLAYLGGFEVEVRRGTGPVLIPRGYFAGLRLDQPLSARLPVGRGIALSGAVEQGVRGMRIEMEGAVVRVVRVGLDEGRFSLPLRLRGEELGPLLLRVVTEDAGGQWVLAGEFWVEGVRAPAPRLELGALALGLGPGEEVVLPVANLGDAALEGLRCEVEGPFLLRPPPERLEVGASAQVGLRLVGESVGEGVLRLHSSDPAQPVAVVALRGLKAGEPPVALRVLRIDAEGRFQVQGKGQDHLLVLCATEEGEEDSAAVYPFALGGALAKPVVIPAPPEDRELLEGFLREQERALALRLGGRPLPAAKPALAEPEVGQRRSFVFPEFGQVRQQVVQARLTALAPRALAWVQEGVPAPDQALVEEVLAQFSGEDYGLIGSRFGLPSDVDGDGRVSLLFTPLVDQVGGLAGFFSAVSALPRDLGGTGDEADLMFLSPSRPAREYRSLLVHEFQHLVNFNQHVLVRGGEGESNWLNEGLSHLAEDLVADYAASGQGQLVAAFLAEPSVVGLAGEALLDRRKRGAAYLFVRSLADRLGQGVVLRLVNTGLADRDNVERATGEAFPALMGGWAVQLYLSGLELFPHPRFEYQSPLLRAGEDRGYPLPFAPEHRAGGPALRGSLRPRGIALVKVHGGGEVAGRVDPRAGARAFLIPLPAGFEPQVFVPPDYIPGLHFVRLLPGRYLTGQEYPVEAQVLDPGHTQVLLRFAGPDTLSFFAEVEGGRFAQTLSLGSDQVGSYALEVFLGNGEGSLDYAGGFGPVEIADPQTQTAVALSPVRPQAWALGPVFPNPFNSAVAVPVQVPEAGAEVEIAVFDLLGQRVRRLYRGPLAAGRQVLIWDGRDETGRLAATGVYLFWAEWGRSVQVRGGVLVR